MVAHGTVETPVFMPVGTQATVKTLVPDELARAGARVLLANTYHLCLRPGVELIRRAGGLHRFMAWNGALLTDSGGFQIVSLADLARLDDDGVTFRSHIDGSQHRFTPETAIDAQESIGADIAMAFDQPIRWGASREEAQEAADRSAAWAERCLRAHRRADQQVFGICQGGFDPADRRESAQRLASLGFQGNAVGGLSVGEPKDLLGPLLDASLSALPEDRPRYVMGVGAPEDLIDAIGRGADMFDCVLPTRLGRNGAYFHPEGRRNILNARYRDDLAPLVPGCDCPACQTFSTAYVHHLFRAREILGLRLLSLHNISFLVTLMVDARAAIGESSFSEFAADFLSRYRTTTGQARSRSSPPGRMPRL